MAFKLPELPFAKSALEPHISAETLEYHYGKHHNAYVVNLNKLCEGTNWGGKSLEDIIREAEGGVFNNGAQVWNHSFYWNCMRPGGGGAPSGPLADAIHSAFGSYEAFAKQFSEAALTQFGSGWAWLVKNGDKVEIAKTSNADNPLRDGRTPILTIDVWEHAYYVDYRNARPKYIETFLASLVNWDFAAKNFEG